VSLANPGWLKGGGGRPTAAILVLATTASCGLGHRVDRYEDRRPATVRTPLAVQADLPAGKLEIGRSAPSQAYDLSLTYCKDHFRPLSRFDGESPDEKSARGRLLTVAALPRTRSSRGWVGSREPNHLSLKFPPGVPLDLRVAAGGESDLDLTTLTVTRLVLHTGAGASRVRFLGGNPRDMELFRIVGGSGPVRLEGLGWGQVTGLEFHGGSGDALLDWTGPGPEESAAFLDPGTGAVSMIFPPDLGVTLSGRGLSFGKCTEGFAPAGGICRSRNYDSAARHLNLILDGGEGRIEFRWKR
jgi:hypothetical protein